ncbi:MAG TPA: LysR family transcriptional regulator [Gammaproteobacteria bacterium]|nr:LysR family transcriptional regulator [Gammaproteobacteria bacterium]
MLLDEMEIFYTVIELGSFAKAADKLGVSKSHISKKIDLLEKHLHAKLITRTTRKLSLTEAGDNFYQQCAKVIEEATKGYAIIHELRGKPAGTLRISAPPAYGIYVLPRIIHNYLSHYPDVKIEVNLSNDYIDLVKQGYDLALRSGKLESSSLIAQKILSVENIICASPSYLKKYGTPEHPNDLETHNFAVYEAAKKSRELVFTKNTHAVTVVINGKIIANQIELSKKLVLESACIASLPKFMVEAEIAAGTIIHCLKDYHLPKSDLYAVYPEREFLPPKVREFIGMLKIA